MKFVTPLIFQFEAVLTSHCLPSGAESPFWNNDYEAFLDWRQQKLWEKIKEVTRMQDAAELDPKQQREINHLAAERGCLEEKKTDNLLAKVAGVR